MLVLHLHLLLLLLLCHLRRHRKALVSWQTCQHLSTHASKHHVQHRCTAECAGLALRYGITSQIYKPAST